MKKNRNKKNFFYINKLYSVCILILTVFMCIGYASINSISIGIGGEIIAKEVEGIYITETKYVSDVNADVSSSKILNAYQTNLNSKVVLSSTNPASSITYTINIIKDIWLVLR